MKRKNRKTLGTKFTTFTWIDSTVDENKVGSSLQAILFEFIDVWETIIGSQAESINSSLTWTSAGIPIQKFTIRGDSRLFFKIQQQSECWMVDTYKYFHV